MANQKPQPPEVVMQHGGKQRKRSLPKLLRILLYGSFIWVCLGAVGYSTGFLIHKGDTFDDIITWSIGLGGPFAILMLYFSLLMYEMD